MPSGFDAYKQGGHHATAVVHCFLYYAVNYLKF